MLVLRTQLAILQARPDFAGLREKIQAIASALEEQEAIPAIKAQMLLIQAIAGDEWWEDVTVSMLETARKKLRALVKLIRKGQEESSSIPTSRMNLATKRRLTCRRSAPA